MKSIEVLHTSFAVYVTVIAVVLLLAAGLAAASPGARKPMARLGKCALAGAAVAGGLVAWVNAKRHAQLVAQAARPVNGHHVTAAYLLADGFAFTFLIVTVIAFAVATLAARRRTPAPWQAAARPRAGAGMWRS